MTVNTKSKETTVFTSKMFTKTFSTLPPCIPSFTEEKRGSGKFQNNIDKNGTVGNG